MTPDSAHKISQWNPAIRKKMIKSNYPIVNFFFPIILSSVIKLLAHFFWMYLDKQKIWDSHHLFT